MSRKKHPMNRAQRRAMKFALANKHRKNEIRKETFTEKAQRRMERKEKQRQEDQANVKHLLDIATELLTIGKSAPLLALPAPSAPPIPELVAPGLRIPQSLRDSFTPSTECAADFCRANNLPDPHETLQSCSASILALDAALDEQPTTSAPTLSTPSTETAGPTITVSAPTTILDSTGQPVSMSIVTPSLSPVLTVESTPVVTDTPQVTTTKTRKPSPILEMERRAAETLGHAGVMALPLNLEKLSNSRWTASIDAQHVETTTATASNTASTTATAPASALPQGKRGNRKSRQKPPAPALTVTTQERKQLAASLFPETDDQPHLIAFPAVVTPPQSTSASAEPSNVSDSTTNEQPQTVAMPQTDTPERSTIGDHSRDRMPFDGTLHATSAPPRTPSHSFSDRVADMVCSRIVDELEPLIDRLAVRLSDRLIDRMTERLFDAFASGRLFNADDERLRAAA